MKPISRNSSVQELAVLVCEALSQAGIEAVLSGGAAVTIYSDNEYQSLDLDFVTSAPIAELEGPLKSLNFSRRTNTRYFEHPDTDFTIEFPAGPLSIGGQVVKDYSQLKTPNGTLRILTPTQCVMDRLAAYYHWSDPQALDQALLVARTNEIDLVAVEKWSLQEDHADRFNRFVKLLIREHPSGR